MKYYWNYSRQAAKWDKSERLERLLEFLNLDIANLPSIELGHAWHALTRPLLQLEVEPIQKSTASDFMDYVKTEGQSQLSYLPRLFNPADIGLLSSEEGRKFLCDFQSLLKDAMTGFVSNPYRFCPRIEISLGHYVDNDGCLRPSYGAHNVVYILLFELSRLLEGTRIATIHKCRECGKFFMGRKGSMYCSKRCAWRVGQRRRRQRDPEKYREYMRDYMDSRRYESEFDNH